VTDLSGIAERRGLLPDWLGDHGGFLDRLRKNDFPIGVTEERRFVELIVRLCSVGIDLSDPRQALPWISPVLCRKSSDQTLLPQLVDQWAALHRVKQDSPKVTEEPTLVDNFSTEIKKNTYRTLFIAGVVAAILLIGLIGGFAYVFYWGAGPEEDRPTAPLKEPVRLENLQDALPDTKRGAVYASIAGVIPVIFSFGLVFYRRHKRVVIARGSVSATARSAPVLVEKQKLFAARGLRRTFQVLRQHSPVASNEINVERTIRATIRTGGFVELRYGTRPALPEYVLLYDEMGMRDHMALLAEGLVTRLDAERIAVTRYSYHGDLQRVRKIGKKPEFMDFAEVAAHHPGQRLLILCGTLELNEYRHEGWLSSLDSWAAAAIIAPNPAGISPETGRILHSLGMSVYEATSDGLEQLGRELSQGALNQSRPLMRAGRNSAGFFARLERNRHTLMRAAEPDPDFVRELIWELRNWLGPEGFVWLGACAIYPDIRPTHTAYFGTYLLDADKQPLATDARLARLACLPWFRYGFMPDWLRLAVRKALPMTRIEEIIRVCFALSSDFKFTSRDVNDAMRLFDKDNVGALGAIKELISGNPNHSLNDRVFLGAIEQKVQELALDAPTSLSRKVRRHLDPTESAMVAGGILLGLGYFLISSITLPLFDRIAWLAGLAKGAGLAAMCLALWMQFGFATGLAGILSERMKGLAIGLAGGAVILACMAFVLDGETMTMFAMVTAMIAWICIALDRSLPRSKLAPSIRRFTDLVQAGTGKLILGITGAAFLQSFNVFVGPLTLDDFELPRAVGGNGELPDILLPASYTIAIMIAVTLMACLSLGWGIVTSLGLARRRCLHLAAAMLFGTLLSFGLSLALSPYAVDIMSFFTCSLDRCSESDTKTVLGLMPLWLGELGLSLGGIAWLGRQRLGKVARFGPWMIAGYLSGLPVLVLAISLVIYGWNHDGTWMFVGGFVFLFAAVSRSLVPFIGFCRSRSLPGQFRYGLAFKCFGFYLLTFCPAAIPPIVCKITDAPTILGASVTVFALYGCQWIALCVACGAYVKRENKPPIVVPPWHTEASAPSPTSAQVSADLTAEPLSPSPPAVSA
jgi:hypothetical protein